MTYRVLRIDEQLYGCEELPEGQPVCCDVLLEDETGERRVTGLFFVSRIFLQISNPSTPGSIRSRIKRSNSSEIARFKPASPSFSRKTFCNP